MKNIFAAAQFLLSVAKLSQLPAEGPAEIAFVGRSNVGKSSALNTLAGRRRLAFTSKTPGRTQLLNFYALGDAARLVDLPGYGFASVPTHVRGAWDRLVGGYLAGRESLAGVVVLMDARRPLTPPDVRLIEWIRPLDLRVLVLLSKVDKLSRRERQSALATARDGLAGLGMTCEVLPFSSHSGEGVEAVRDRVGAWLVADPGE